MSAVTVRSLTEPSASQIFTCAPREAVIAAHAQSQGDYSTWDYESRYGHLVIHTDNNVTCGDFTARVQ